MAFPLFMDPLYIISNLLYLAPMDIICLDFEGKKICETSKHKNIVYDGVTKQDNLCVTWHACF